MPSVKRPLLSSRAKKTAFRDHLFNGIGPWRGESIEHAGQMISHCVEAMPIVEPPLIAAPEKRLVGEDLEYGRGAYSAQGVGHMLGQRTVAIE